MSDHIDENFRRSVIVLRERRGISQSELATLAGLGHQTVVSKIEQGDRKVTLGEAYRISRIVGIPLPLMYLDETQDKVINFFSGGGFVGEGGPIEMDTITQTRANGELLDSYKIED